MIDDSDSLPTEPLHLLDILIPVSWTSTSSIGGLVVKLAVAI
jgi:hypothetical protein